LDVEQNDGMGRLLQAGATTPLLSVLLPAAVIT
jgi:hypothetical protein